MFKPQILNNFTSFAPSTTQTMSSFCSPPSAIFIFADLALSESTSILTPSSFPSLNINSLEKT